MRCSFRAAMTSTRLPHRNSAPTSVTATSSVSPRTRMNPISCPPRPTTTFSDREYLTLSELTRRLTAGARFVGSTVQMADGSQPTADESVLFAIGPNGAMRPATGNKQPAIHNGDTVIRFLAPT